MNELLINLSKVLPALAVLAIVFGFIGWQLRGLRSAPPAAAKPGKPLPATDKGRDERVKNLEASLEKSKAALKSAKAELEALKSATITKENHDSAVAELAGVREALARETKRTATLETDLKRAQETLKSHNTRANDADRAQKERDFALQNELSKARQELAELRQRPDDSRHLESEIERLRDSVATSTRFAGEMRKREAAALEELEKMKNRLEGKPESPTPAPSAPPQESNRVAAAKAEVLRLVEQNKRAKAAETAAGTAPEIAEAAPAVTEDAAAPVEPAPAVVEPAEPAGTGEAAEPERPVTIAPEEPVSRA